MITPNGTDNNKRDAIAIMRGFIITVFVDMNEAYQTYFNVIRYYSRILKFTGWLVLST